MASIIATDAWWNQVPVQPQVHFQSNNFFQMITPNDSNLDPDGTAQFDLFFKAATAHDLQVHDLIEPTYADNSAINVTPAEFSRLYPQPELQPYFERWAQDLRELLEVVREAE